MSTFDPSSFVLNWLSAFYPLRLWEEIGHMEASDRCRTPSPPRDGIHKFKLKRWVVWALYAPSEAVEMLGLNSQAGSIKHWCSHHVIDPQLENHCQFQENLERPEYSGPDFKTLVVTRLISTRCLEVVIAGSVLLSIHTWISEVVGWNILLLPASRKRFQWGALRESQSLK